MAEERRPFRFVIPPAEAQSFSQPGPYLFPHYQNYNYQALPTAVPHFVAATHLGTRQPLLCQVVKAATTALLKLALNGAQTGQTPKQGFSWKSGEIVGISSASFE